MLPLLRLLLLLFHLITHKLKNDIMFHVSKALSVFSSHVRDSYDGEAIRFLHSLRVGGIASTSTWSSIF